MLITYLVFHYFFPGHSNNQKAKLLHPSSVFFFILSLVVFQVVLQFLPTSGLKILGYAANIPPQRVMEITNQKRVEIGLAQLDYSPVLAQAAAAKGADMLEKDYWAHVAPNGAEPWGFFIDAGYKYRYAGENLARDFSNPEAAIEAWMASPTHRDNMLSSKYEEIGIAVVEGDMDGIDTTIIVQLFGTRYVDTVPLLPVASANVGSEIIVTLTPAPTVTMAPEPTKTPVVAASIQDTVAPPRGIEGQVLVSPFSTTRGISIIAVFLLLGVLIIDGIIISKRKVSRIGGRTFAHLAFLGMILAIALVARAGNIL